MNQIEISVDRSIMSVLSDYGRTWYVRQDQAVIAFLRYVRDQWTGEWIVYMLYPNLLTSIRFIQLKWIIPLAWALDFSVVFFGNLLVFFFLDYLDGKSARAFGYTSDAGAFLDQAVDKALTIPLLVTFCLKLWGWYWIPAVPLIIIDSALLGLRALRHWKKDQASPSNLYGKTKMAVLSVTILLILCLTGPVGRSINFFLLFGTLYFAWQSYRGQKYSTPMS